jgi:hypothetical protein
MRAILFAIASIAIAQIPQAFAVERDSIERTQAAFDAQLTLACDQSSQAEWVAEDAVYQYALTGIDTSLRVEGRAAIKAHLCALSAVGSDVIAENIHYYPTLDPEMVYVQYDVVPIDGIGENSREVAAVIQMRADQIVRFTQLSRSAESLDVLEAAIARKQ